MAQERNMVERWCRFFAAFVCLSIVFNFAALLAGAFVSRSQGGANDAGWFVTGMIPFVLAYPLSTVFSGLTWRRSAVVAVLLEAIKDIVWVRIMHGPWRDSTGELWAGWDYLVFGSLAGLLAAFILAARVEKWTVGRAKARESVDQSSS